MFGHSNSWLSWLCQGWLAGFPKAGRSPSPLQTDRPSAVSSPPRLLPGDYIGKVTPVPISNTVVKLSEPMIVLEGAKVGIAGIFCKTKSQRGNPLAFFLRIASDPSSCPTRFTIPGPNRSMSITAPPCNLSVQLGRLKLANPILVASGTFGYAREMESLVQLRKLGGILPKTVTRFPRAGNAPWRTVETAAGLLNSIGLDNDGVDEFIRGHMPYLATLETPVIVSVAGKTADEFVELARLLDPVPGVAGLELNVSCPNVSGGIDFGADPAACERVVASVRQVTELPVLAKLTPNVTRIADVARGAEAGGADAICLINTVLGMAVDWRRRRPLLGNVVGGLSGPAIKPIALRCVHQVAAAVKTPLVGIGGISNLDDVMEFLVTGASAIQVGTANYFDPSLSERLVDALPGALAEAGVASVVDLVGTLRRNG
ncbi:MAG: Dihydroorotate dehydrogenase catalytic subunit [Planctomycetota bacterium]